MHLILFILFYIVFPAIIIILWVKMLYLNEISIRKRIGSCSANSSEFGTISLIIPARNEEKNIGECILDARKSRYAFREIIIINDQSTDGTASMVNSLKDIDPRITLLNVEMLPEGWIGKNYALYMGAQHAQADWLLFIDADVRINEYAAERAISYASKEGINILSLSPYQICVTVCERIIQPSIFCFLNCLFPLNAINKGGSSKVALNGSFILMKRKDYFAINGHQAVQNAILEDVELAKVAVSNNLKIALLSGYPLAMSRMYRSFIELWHGWSKNLFLLIKASQKSTVGILLQVILLYLYPVFILLIFGKILHAICFYLVNAVMECIIRERSRQYAEYYFFFPVAGAILTVLIINSFIQNKILRKVVWRKRAYRL